MPHRCITRSMPICMVLAAFVVVSVIMSPSTMPTLTDIPPGVSSAEAAACSPVPPGVREALRGEFRRKGVAYPPEGVTLVGIKDEYALEVWADTDTGPAYIRTYEVCAASGDTGPKLMKGDMQVPEGIYRIDRLNPVSSYHLSFRLDYPNEFDREMAERDGRRELGGDIYIHGGCKSVGCLAMGDEAIEELFALVEDAGVMDCRVIIAPADFRVSGPPPSAPDVGCDWVGRLYENIYKELAAYRRPV